MKLLPQNFFACEKCAVLQWEKNSMSEHKYDKYWCLIKDCGLWQTVYSTINIFTIYKRPTNTLSDTPVSHTKQHYSPNEVTWVTVKRERLSRCLVSPKWRCVWECCQMPLAIETCEAEQHDLLLSDMHTHYATALLVAPQFTFSLVPHSVWAVLLSVRSRSQPAELERWRD